MSARLGNVLRSEVRRALHRRAVWVLVGIAFVGIAALGIIAFADSGGRTVAEMRAEGTHPAVMRDWWVDGSGDGILIIAALPLFIGGLIGGASVVGAEWRAGTITTVLTWEPRRVRVHAVRMAAVFGLAVLFAFVLQALFLSATLPAVFAHGSTAGTDGAWWLDLGSGLSRLALLTGTSAVLGASIASIGRSTAFGLGAVFVWVGVGEPIVRGLKPSLQHMLLAENVATVAQWASLEGVLSGRSPAGALMTVALYVMVVGVGAAMVFARRDVAAAV